MKDVGSVEKMALYWAALTFGGGLVIGAGLVTETVGLAGFGYLVAAVGSVFGIMLVVRAARAMDEVAARVARLDRTP
ncbi:hypothetical protein [Isoptericola sp. AK164]|uniref:hypothetical protein n=1 Tax=Isoptericola sp. AK164 TaxID=3024246 RepID=UPI0024188FFE|nr:hypothetical protein [Isoptericola sp. AK164]